MSKEFWKKKRSKHYSHGKEQEPIQKIDTIDMWTFDKGKTSSTIKIATWNVNGIRSVINQRRLIPYLDKNEIDIICLNETKINYEAYNKSPIKIHGYCQYWNFCKCSSGYSGVAIFSKYLPISMTEDLPDPKHCQEGRVITLQFDKFYLVAVYFPNSGKFLSRLKYRMQFDADFYDYCEKLKNKKHVIICGDLNVVRNEIDIYKSQNKVKMAENMPGCSNNQRIAFKSFLKNGWVDVFRQLNPQSVKYSWWDNQIEGRKNGVGWRIDYFIVNSEILENVKSCEIRCEVLGSDHCPVESIFNLSNLKQNTLTNSSEKGKDPQRRFIDQKSQQSSEINVEKQKQNTEKLNQQKEILQKVEKQGESVKREWQKGENYQGECEKKQQQEVEKIQQSIYKKNNNTKESEEKQKLKEIPFILKNRDRCTPQ